MTGRDAAADATAPGDRCLGCGGRFADPADPGSHAYMLSSAGCWAAFNTLLAREYQDPALFERCHRLTVDAYAVQHRGTNSDPRAIRSLWLHFIALDAVIAGGLSHPAARAQMQRLAGRAVPPLPDATPVFTTTLADVMAAGADDHVEAVTRWAACAHASWAPILAPLKPAD